jgi:hypothetical protein
MVKQMIKVYTLPNCVRCEILKNELHKRCIYFETAEMDTSESMAEMRVEGCFAIEAPVLAIIDGVEWKFIYGEELFSNGKLDLSKVTV